VKLAPLLLVLLALPLDAWALEQGARVRVTLLAREAPQVTGFVLAIPADSLVVAAEPDSAREAIARLDIKKLEISRGMKSNAGRGATFGALLLGFTFGAIVMNGVAESEITDGGQILLTLGGAGIGALVGGGIGGLIGSASHREKWDDVQVKRK
jgi:hypothetical protein